MVFALAREITEGIDREAMYILCLDQKNKVIGVNMISLGTLTTTAIHPREVMKVPVLLNAASFILFHNHPSDEPDPSPEDVTVTRSMKEAGDLMGINMRDHVIVGRDRYISMMEEYPEFQEKI